MILKISKFFLYLVPFAAVIVYQGTLFPFIVGKYVFFRTVIDLALIFFVFAWAVGETNNLHWGANNKQFITNNKSTKKLPVMSYKLLVNPLVIAVATFAIIYVISGFFGYNPSASFWSNFERGEGGFQMLHLLIFFLLMVLLFDTKAWEKMFNISVWVSALVIFYGLGAVWGWSGFAGPNTLCSRFAGSLGNPAYVGTFFIFTIFYSLYLGNENKWRKKWLWIPLILFFLFFLLLSQTRGALLGLSVGIIIGLIYVFFKLPKGKIKNIVLAGTILLVILGSLAVKFRKNIDLMPFCGASGGNRIIDISFATETYQTRLLLWKQSIQAWKERPLLGWGPENFSIAFEKYYDTGHYNPAIRAKSRYSQVWYDRAHNIFFDYLVFSGILGLLSFLGIFAALFWRFFKKAVTSNKELVARQEAIKNKKSAPVTNYQLLVANTLIISLPVAYLVQGLVLFDVLPIYINIFIFLAFANFKLNPNEHA